MMVQPKKIRHCFVNTLQWRCHLMVNFDVLGIYGDLPRWRVKESLNLFCSTSTATSQLQLRSEKETFGGHSPRIKVMMQQHGSPLLWIWPQDSNAINVTFGIPTSLAKSSQWNPTDTKEVPWIIFDLIQLSLLVNQWRRRWTRCLGLANLKSIMTKYYILTFRPSKKNLNWWSFNCETEPLRLLIVSASRFGTRFFSF